MKHSSQPRATAELSKSLNHQLNMYALAASATGVGLLALSQPADAEIVYTPAHVRIVAGTPATLDLNHDGVVDFYVVRNSTFNGFIVARELSACQYVRSTYYGGGPICYSANTNGIRNIGGFAVALRRGARVKNGERFTGPVKLGRVSYTTTANTYWRGPWFNGGKGVKNRYLGFKFIINRVFHYGWARLTVATTQRDFTATLTGYAYETIPGKGIVAGQTKGHPHVITPPVQTQTSTLGHLALGRK